MTSLATLPPATWLTFIALAASAVALWLPWRSLWVGWFVAAVVTGYVAGVLSGPAIVPIVMLAAACWGYRAQRSRPVFPGARLAFALVIVVVALALGFHAFRGFHHPLYVQELLLSPGARPYTKSLSFDVWLVGVLILGIGYERFIRSKAELLAALKRAWPVIVVNVIVLVPLALLLGFVRPDPKWTSFFWIWAALQLCFTILTEEAFFRGFIQRELAVALKQRRFGEWVAIGVAAVLFGLVHFGGGMSYVILATLAGVGYGIAFQRSGRIEMSMLAHFTVNATRFLFFTYPYLA